MNGILVSYYLVPAGDQFQLWHGYVESESNFHYERFVGFQGDGSECWILERSERQSNATLIAEWVARDLIRAMKILVIA